jgi:hypothetical protein
MHASRQRSGSGAWHRSQCQGPGPLDRTDSRHHAPPPQSEQGRVGSIPRSSAAPETVPPASRSGDVGGTVGTGLSSPLSQPLSRCLSRRKASLRRAVRRNASLSVPRTVPVAFIPDVNCPAVPTAGCGTVGQSDIDTGSRVAGLPIQEGSLAFRCKRFTALLERPVSSAISRTLIRSVVSAATRAPSASAKSRMVHPPAPNTASNGFASSP